MEREREMKVRKSKRMWTYVLIEARKIDRENPKQSGGLCFQVKPKSKPKLIEGGRNLIVM